MKKGLFIVAIILVLSSIIFTGCSSTSSPTPAKTSSAPAATSAAPAASVPAAAPGAIELKMSTFLPDVPPGANCHLFRDDVAKASNGAIVIKLVGPEAMAAPDAPSAAQRGTIDIADDLYPYLNTLIPSIDSLGRAEFNPMELRNNPVYKYVQDNANKAGLYYLAWAYRPILRCKPWSTPRNLSLLWPN